MIHEHIVIRSLGEFTSFEDGRIRVKFFDRTILELNGIRTQVHIIYKHGIEANVELPLESEHEPVSIYLHHAMEFANWTFLTESQREEAKRYIIHLW